MQQKMDVYKQGRIIQQNLRQKDSNVPNYRIVPYKSSINVGVNDYYMNTMDEQQKQILKIRNDYINLTQTVWRIFSEIDSSFYDPNILFFGLQSQQIYDKISLIRSLNAYEPEEQSLKLSAIVRIDDNLPSRANNNISSKIDDNQTSYNKQCKQLSEQTLHIDDNNVQIKQQNLYQIQQQEQCCQNSLGIQLKIAKSTWPVQKISQQQQHSPNFVKHRRTLSNLSTQKRESRRSSLLLREKISLAFHQQQELRQILQEQLQTITNQLDEKNQYLNWAVEELGVRNQLIQKLKEVLILRDQVLQAYEKNQVQGLKSLQNQQENLEERDKQIGLLINSLIQRTQETQQDFQFLAKSLQVSTSNNFEQNKQVYEKQPKKGAQSINLEEIQLQAKSAVQDKFATSLTINTIAQLNEKQQESIEYEVLKPKRMNFDQIENITYLTKQHFFQAQKIANQRLTIANVKMIQSVGIQNSPDSFKNS